MKYMFSVGPGGSSVGKGTISILIPKITMWKTIVYFIFLPHGVKLARVSKCSRCQIDLFCTLGVKLVQCQIDLGVKFQKYKCGSNCRKALV